MTHLRSYLKALDSRTPAVTDSVKKTVKQITAKHIEPFSFKEREKGLLLGEVQSGKTGQMLGIAASAADHGFELFILLTTSNNYLQQQTFTRAVGMLETFVVCDESDEIRFMQNDMRKPVLIVLKKETNILRRWRNTLSSSGFCADRPIFILDDEGDAASLNTKVNLKETSTINQHLDSMQQLCSSSFYLQITATPQSLLLQASASGWKPAFVHYFPPGKGYLGGDFFYSKPPSYVIKAIPDDELDQLIDGKKITEGLTRALLTFLCSAAHLFLKEEATKCNFLIHPSVSIEHHDLVASRIEDYLEWLIGRLGTEEFAASIKEIWEDLQSSKPDLASLKAIHDWLKKNASKAKILIMNSQGTLDADYESGVNIIVGGNSLSRGVTFPALQTVYYCRRSRSPQADSFWQHSRMFGYDRDRGLMRVFMPPLLHKLFTELNNSHKVLVEQVRKHDIDNINLLYPPGIRPTRLTVVNQDNLNFIAGDVNYFPRKPKENNLAKLDKLLQEYDDGLHDINLKKLGTLIGEFESHSKADWPTKAYVNCVNALIADDAPDLAKLLVSRGRDIGSDTGTMLSPDDRQKGDSIDRVPVLTVYRVTGRKWESGQPFWMPNIKFPAEKFFYKSD